jgi:tetratricopeptide (TPR) repeat protein
MDNEKLDFFISYTGCDEEQAKWIVEVLGKRGYSCFCQYKDIKPGQNFLLEMDKAIKNCERIISILSQAYMQSFHADEEWTGFLAQKKYANIIPVRIEDFKPDGLWGARVYIDIAGKDKQDTEQILLDGLAHIKPASPTEIIRLGTVKINSNLPKRNLDFTGREDTLCKIHQALNKNESLALATAGLGGIGKSQLAIEYAYRYATEYQYIWWVNAKSNATIYASLEHFALNFGLVDKESRYEYVDLLNVVHAWMQQTDNWLFIFDDAKDEEQLSSYLPAFSSHRHVLITSRFAKWIHHRALNIDIFSETEASAFLTHRTGLVNDEFQDKLMMELGYLPLALEQAAAYIKIHEKSYEEYLKLFIRHRTKLIKEYPLKENCPTVAITIQTSIEKIDNIAAKELLNICVFLAPDNILLKWFDDANTYLPVDDEIDFNNAILNLTRYSLITSENKALRIHPLVREIVKDSLSHDKQAEYLNQCVQILVKQIDFDFSTAESRIRFSAFFPHINSVTNGISNEDATKEIAQLYHFLGYGYSQLADYSRALKWYEEALCIREKVLGKDHPDTATTYNNIALVYNKKGDYDKALEYCGKALDIDEKVLGKDRPDTATTYNNIAGVYNNKGDYDKALEYYGKDLAISEKILGKDHPDTAATYNNIASVYNNKGDYDRVLEYCGKALDIVEKVLGKDHPDTATTYNNIAGVYNKKGDYDKALEYYGKDLAISEKILGKDHPDTATTYNNIALVYSNKSDYDKALEYYWKALDIVKKVLGKDHPYIATTYNNIALVYGTKSDYDKALEYYWKALDIVKKVLGKDHPSTATIYNNIAVVYDNKGDHDKSLEYYNLSQAMKDK